MVATTFSPLSFFFSIARHYSTAWKWWCPSNILSPVFQTRPSTIIESALKCKLLQPWDTLPSNNLLLQLNPLKGESAKRNSFGSTVPNRAMFPVIEVPADAADLPEQLGTKPKFWFGDNKYLFKETRPGTGEDWSEKVASELCDLLVLSHATYELGIWKGRRGVISKTFLPEGSRLIHGNEILLRMDPTYPTRKFFRVRQHTLRGVLAFLRPDVVNPPLGFQPCQAVNMGVDVFLGYLMLDAWIGNQDRHHENWGLVLTREKRLHLAPSYDHASSLGRIETDDEKWERLRTTDKNRSIEHYVERAASAFYATRSSRKPLSTLDAFLSAASFRPYAALSWLKRLEGIPAVETENILRKIPDNRISEASILFAQRVLFLNRTRLLGCVEALLK